uniref:U-actitoxin-Bgr3d n=1 Tax=Bunodosoma granuliferum TaxID=31164 RepID=BDS3D_BUNGR|nr:RecName: Full=U-actitoxin-Bgr3d; Short=U-AITX-Bgr3d; AltName: Full=U-AITX-Bg1e; Flags: Precursor [Bunodosoma granuliferum]CCC86606.1 U-AITX-Bgr3d protein [Bunodosoma granuliferum]
MSYERLLCLVLVASFIAASVAQHPGDAPRMEDDSSAIQRRGLPCGCRGKSGIYWFSGKCPGGYGYTTYCSYVIGLCCVK